MKKPRSDEPQKRHDNDGLHRRRGTWYYCLNIAGERRFFSTKCTNYQEARKVRAKAIQDQEAGRLPNDLSKWPFEKLLAQVIENRKVDLSENSRRIDKERSGPLLKHFTGRRVSTIDAAAIRAYQAERSRKVGNRTINLETKLLRNVLKTAKTWATVADDYKPLKEDRRGPGRAIEEHQEKLLFDTARSRPGWDAAFFCALVAANTTMRGCELKSLRIANIDLLNREVSIQRSKGGTAGVRRIPLNDGAVWGFARLLERAQALGSTAPEHFVLPGFKYRSKKADHGTGYDATRPQKTWRTAWRALVKEAGRRAGRKAAQEAIGQGWRPGIAAWRRAAASFSGLRFHDLRHLAITKLAESEASDAVIMSISGHLSRSMMEHYSHVRAAAKRTAVDAIRSYVPPEENTVSTTKRVQ
jgi:integrase